MTGVTIFERETVGKLMPYLLAAIVGVAATEQIGADQEWEKLLASSGVMAGAFLWLGRMVWKASQRNTVVDETLSRHAESMHDIAALVRETQVSRDAENGKVLKLFEELFEKVSSLTATVAAVQARCEERSGKCQPNSIAATITPGNTRKVD